MTMPDRKALEVGEADFSHDGVYRYWLSRIWSDGPRLLFIGLNPSTADTQSLDPTLRRVIGFAMREGCGGLFVGNLFAFRSKSPKVMMGQSDPVGPDNDKHLLALAETVLRGHGLILAGWGINGVHRGRSEEVADMLSSYDLMCLGVTKNRQPWHPLYVKGDTPLEMWA